MKHDQIVQADWLLDAIPRVNQSLRLWKENKLPRTIETFMVVTPIKHALRGIYGCSNIGVAWILLRDAIAERLQHEWWGVQHWLGFRPYEDDLKETQ